jgi:hypothetical protein
MAPPTPPLVQPDYGATPAPAQAVAKSSSAIKIGGLLALVGGAAAALSAWLPSLIVGDDLMKTDNWYSPWDKWSQIQSSVSGTGYWDFTYPNGHILVVAGAVAAVCGLLLFSGLVRPIPARFLLALVAIAGAVAVLAMEYSVYGTISSDIDAANAIASAPLTTMGFGLYIGVAGGAAAILGSLVALSGRTE